MDLSIIIVSFNTKKLLKDCLESIFERTLGISFEVIIVDNNSSDGSPEMIKKEHSQVTLIRNKANLGFGKANNQGAREAKGKYLLFLNPDTLLIDNPINKIIDFVKKNEKIDICGCKLLNKDKTLQPSVGFFPNLPRVFFWMFFIDDIPVIRNLIKPYHQKMASFYQKEREVDWVTGAFLVIKREVFDKIGGFDEQFFMYEEEVDLCFLAKKGGSRAFYTPVGQVIHLKGGQSVEGFQRAVLLEFQGLINFFKKHKPSWQLPILKVLLRLGAFLRFAIFGILLGNSEKKRIYEKAFFFERLD